jgi:acyl transferase domain-containing protein
VSIAIVFPGQGSEEPAMGLPYLGDPIFDHASAACGEDVPRLLDRGGRALSRTEVLQPVLAAVGLASIRALGITPAWVAGHSLGELVAACVAARVDPKLAVELAAFRGAAMAEAAASRPGAMAAMRGAPADIEPLGVTIAAHNAPDETVVAGDEAQIAAVLARARGTKLRTLGAWHSPHMLPAVEPLRAKLRDILGAPTIPVVGLDLPLHDSLAESLVRPVRFVDTLLALEAAGARHIVVAAPSRVVRSLVRRTLGTRVAIHAAEDGPKLLTVLRTP